MAETVPIDTDVTCVLLPLSAISRRIGCNFLSKLGVTESFISLILSLEAVWLQIAARRLLEMEVLTHHL